MVILIFLVGVFLISLDEFLLLSSLLNFIFENNYPNLNDLSNGEVVRILDLLFTAKSISFNIDDVSDISSWLLYKV